MWSSLALQVCGNAIHTCGMHTHTHKSTQNPSFSPPSSSTFPKFSLAASSTAAHIISREWHAAPKNTQRLSTVSRSYLPLQGTDPPNQPSTTFFSLLYATRTNLQCETWEMRNASCLSTYCTCIIPCVNQTGQDLTCSFLKASAWSVVCLRHMQLDTNYKNPIKTDLNWIEMCNQS